MTKRQIAEANETLKNEIEYLATLHDDDNPKFALQTINSSILRLAVEGKIDLNELAKKELEQRGE